MVIGLFQGVPVDRKVRDFAVFCGIIRKEDVCCGIGGVFLFCRQAGAQEQDPMRCKARRRCKKNKDQNHRQNAPPLCGARRGSGLCRCLLLCGRRQGAQFRDLDVLRRLVPAPVQPVVGAHILVGDLDIEIILIPAAPAAIFGWKFSLCHRASACS
jgi:hypothetical protein